MNDFSHTLWNRLFHAYLLLLIWLPLPLGSNRAWAWSLMEGAVLLLLTAWLLLQWRHPSTDLSFLQSIKPSLWLFLAALIYPFLQAISLPEVVVSLLSPQSAAIRHLAQMDPGGPLSLDAHATLVEWLKGVAYGGLFWLTLVLINSQQRLQTLLWVLLANGVVQVCISLLLISTSDNTDVRGSFVNRNHLAGFLELVLPLAIGLLRYMPSRSGSARHGWDRAHAVLRLVTGSFGVLAGLSIILWTTLILTQSRAGNASLLLAFLVVFLFSRADRGEQKERSYRSPIRIFLVFLLLLLGSGAGLEILLGRFLDTNLLQEGRMAVLLTGKEIIRDFPLFGSGSGTFAYIYPHYQHPSIAQHFFDHAHNDHLELLADRGLIGYSLLALTVLTVWFRTVRYIRLGKNTLFAATCYATLLSTISLTFHGLLDFNFHIPVNAAYFSVLLGLGLRCSRIESPPPQAGFDQKSM
ncbi:O-antigen ligase family protein [Candidatus Magnetaquicoccus inordinatus]|uniref:O-antigen ligase family protein n=1 Tax=Candidatus Magnetaquicoccus inordinatus TaxID=2496818 RepID=UPI00187D6D25|nr:O-antigen ligase family protein [Candidatus Magnetaquicoccus inordinatus]